MKTLLFTEAGQQYWAAAPHSPLWHEALALVRETYSRQGILIQPRAEPEVLRFCCMSDEGLLGTVGARHARFSCASKFPESFRAHLGAQCVLEVTQLAVSASRQVSVMLNLLRTFFLYAVHYGAQQVICEVHPAHVSFYARAGFEEVDRLVAPGVQPAVFLAVPIERMHERMTTALQLRGRNAQDSAHVLAQLAKMPVVDLQGHGAAA